MIGFGHKLTRRQPMTLPGSPQNHQRRMMPPGCVVELSRKLAAPGTLGILVQYDHHRVVPPRHVQTLLGPPGRENFRRLASQGGA